MNFENSVGYVLLKYNIVLNVTIWESEEDFLAVEESLYSDPFHPKGAKWMKIPKHNKCIGKRFVYNEAHDFFHPPQPFPSWTLDIDVQDWVPPVPAPGYPFKYDWNEEKLEFVIHGKVMRNDTLDNLLEDIENES